MLTTLAQFALGSRYKAMVAAGLLAMPGFMLPPLLWLSCGVVALVVLVNGALEGLGIIAMGIALMVVPALVFGGSAMLGIATFAAWIFTWFAAYMLSKTRSLEMGVIASIVAGVAALGLASVMIGPEQAAAQLAFFEKRAPELMAKLNTNAETWKYSLWLGQAIAVFLGTLLGLFIGRSMQARISKPGAFREEFYGLFMGKPLVVVAVVLAALTFFLRQPLLLGVLSLVLLALAIQGIAIVHALVSRTAQASFYLVVFYFGLLIFNVYGLLFLAVVGMADHWMNLRAQETVTD